MLDLKDALDALYELNELRDRAKELREQGRLALTDIKDAEANSDSHDKSKSAWQELRARWIRSENSVENALLMKVQNHKDLSEDDKENDESEAENSFKDRLEKIDLEDLFPTSAYELQEGDEGRGDHAIPVLVAARAMQALVTRSETVFSKATLLCYYRIVEELYMAAPPDWTIGAARAGTGGNTSAFITGECIRAIFAFEDAMKRTVTFFQQTHRLLGRYKLLDSMFSVLETEPPSEKKAAAGNGRKVDVADATDEQAPPMEEWADRAIERMWFDWYISTNPRHGNMALHLPGTGNQNENQLLFHPSNRVDMKYVGEYLDGLKEKLARAVDLAKREITEAKREIDEYRRNTQGAQGKFFEHYITEENELKRRPNPPLKDEKDEKELDEYKKKLREYDRTLTAHRFASSLIEKAESEVNKSAEFIADNTLQDILEKFGKQFDEISHGIHRVLEPAKRYIRTVLQREVAASAFGQGRFDAGELVFAAASFGAITDWKPSEFLTRACALLVEALPENGRLPTTRPFHSTLRGHRMLPIGCEMTRSLAQLLQKNNYEIEPNLVRRMLNIFEEKLISLESPSQDDKKKRVAWNFEGSPNPNKPCVWVTAVSVLAIDRVVRMLNERINAIIFKYFEVIKPEKARSTPTLNDLVYPDLGLSEYHHSQLSMALRLEQMRAHVMRVTLPEMYRDEKGEKERIFSAIFYGPPGTGKTTLVEALALTSGVPLIRLSPGDLVVRGAAEIEGRARAVFEALSMLTQVVIILDEFEGVVGQRAQSEEKKTDEIYEILRTGMLPKLLKLNKTARMQSFVYCLATNFLEKIDPAAKRKGRFDLQLPIYNPDPLSRAGTLLYRLRRVAQKLDRDGGFSPQESGMAIRFIEIVEMTSNTHAGSADDYFRLPEWAIDQDLARPGKSYEEEIPFFWYVLKGEENKEYKRKKELLGEERQKVQEELNKMSGNLSSNETKEHQWLEKYEAQLKKMQEKGVGKPTREILSCLIGPKG
ncbi:MAG TPA: ATP-binding protein [Pyrinomonadaceae bacterium]|jgi:hypothetical protein